MLVYGLGQALIPELCQDKSGSLLPFPITWNQFYVSLVHISFTHHNSLPSPVFSTLFFVFLLLFRLFYVSLK